MTTTLNINAPGNGVIGVSFNHVINGNYEAADKHIILNSVVGSYNTYVYLPEQVYIPIKLDNGKYIIDEENVTDYEKSLFALITANSNNEAAVAAVAAAAAAKAANYLNDIPIYNSKEWAIFVGENAENIYVINASSFDDAKKIAENSTPGSSRISTPGSFVSPMEAAKVEVAATDTAVKEAEAKEAEAKVVKQMEDTVVNGATDMAVKADMAVKEVEAKAAKAAEAKVEAAKVEAAKVEAAKVEAVKVKAANVVKVATDTVVNAAMDKAAKAAEAKAAKTKETNVAFKAMQDADTRGGSRKARRRTKSRNSKKRRGGRSKRRPPYRRR